MRKFFPLPPTAAIHLLRLLFDNILREDGHYSIAIMVLNSILLLVSLNCKNQGFDIKYDDVYNGNHCPLVSCSIYLPDCTFIWLIEFGFVVMDFGDLAWLPHKFLSVPMPSNEALLVLFLCTIMHS